jgi:aminoglycoside phosphotransferase (APT) family kinase protein
MKMHDDEFVITAALVEALVADQFPAWRGFPLQAVESSGTVNALFRLGDELLVRLPRIESGVEGVEHEHRWLPEIARHIFVAVPEVRGLGRPCRQFPYPWSVRSWIDGLNPKTGNDGDDVRLALDVARFIDAMQGLDISSAPPAYRGGPLTDWDEPVRSAISELDGRVDVAWAAKAWERSLQAPRWEGEPVWVHSDLMPGNLLVSDSHLVGVIDFETAGVGDPACDLMVAWNLLTPRARQAFRAVLGVDDATWLRGQGWALAQALVALPYYWDTNPAMVATAKYVLGEILTDRN